MTEICGYVVVGIVMMAIVGSQLIPFIPFGVRIALVSVGFVLGIASYTY